MKPILRHAFFDTVRALGTRRWLAVPVVMFLAGIVALDRIEFDYRAQRPRDVNVWDAPLAMMADPALVVFVLILGFVFVTGDLYVRDRASGTAAMTLLRSNSRAGWWSAKVISLGALALVYSVVAFLCILAVSAINLPFSLGASPAAQVPWGSEDALYPRFEAMPVPLFLLLVVLYTALALWAVGTVVLGISLLLPHPIVPLAAGLLWVMTAWLLWPLGGRQGIGTLDPIYQVTYVFHFGNEILDALPWTTSFAVVAGTLILVLTLGAWRLRETDM